MQCLTNCLEPLVLHIDELNKRLFASSKLCFSFSPIAVIQLNYYFLCSVFFCVCFVPLSFAFGLLSSCRSKLAVIKQQPLGLACCSRIKGLSSLCSSFYFKYKSPENNSPINSLTLPSTLQDSFFLPTLPKKPAFCPTDKELKALRGIEFSNKKLWFSCLFGRCVTLASHFSSFHGVFRFQVQFHTYIYLIS